MLIQACVRATVVASALSCWDARGAEVPSKVGEHALVVVTLADGEDAVVLSAPDLEPVTLLACDGGKVFTGPPGRYLVVATGPNGMQAMKVQIVAAGPPPAPVPPGPSPGPVPPTPGPDVPPDDSLGATGAKLYPLIRGVNDRANCVAMALRYRLVLDELNAGRIVSTQVARTALDKSLGAMTLPTRWQPVVVAMMAEGAAAKGDIEALKKVLRGTIAALELAAK